MSIDTPLFVTHEFWAIKPLILALLLTNKVSFPLVKLLRFMIFANDYANGATWSLQK